MKYSKLLIRNFIWKFCKQQKKSKTILWIFIDNTRVLLEITLFQNLPQLCSSLPSSQSLWPLQCIFAKIHSPVVQLGFFCIYFKPTNMQYKLCKCLTHELIMLVHDTCESMGECWVHWCVWVCCVSHIVDHYVVVEVENDNVVDDYDNVVVHWSF